MANYFEHIKGLNNLQLCHFLRCSHSNLELGAFALMKAENPDIYCSDDNFAIGTPKGKRDDFIDTIYWHRCLSKDYDELIKELNSQEYKNYIRNGSEWLEDSDHGQEYGTTWACSKCGHSLHQPYIWNPRERKWRYCPWCGSRMIEEKEMSEGKDVQT